MRTELLIYGMRANACRERVAEALRAIEGVGDVDVNLYRARAVVVHDALCTPARLAAAVTRAGFGAAPVDGRDPPAGKETLR